MSCGTAGYDRHRAPSTGLESAPATAPRRSVPAVFFTLTALAFGVFALILFGFAFRAVVDGRIGKAVLFGVLGLFMLSATGAVAVFA
jgi:hypothetical protein